MLDEHETPQEYKNGRQWSVHAIDAGRFVGVHGQWIMVDRIQVDTGWQPFHLRIDLARQGYAVLMQGLDYGGGGFQKIVEDWREVTFIPFKSEAKAEEGKKYKMWCLNLQGTAKGWPVSLTDLGG